MIFCPVYVSSPILDKLAVLQPGKKRDLQLVLGILGLDALSDERLDSLVYLGHKLSRVSTQVMKRF